MQTVGYVCPETEAEARGTYEEIGPAARTISREVALALGFDESEYAERMSSEVVGTTRDAVFGALLRVHTDTMDGFETWREEHQGWDVRMEGSEPVEHVAWHPAPVTDSVVATTYQDEREAAVATLRRIAWGSVYRPVLRPEDEE